MSRAYTVKIDSSVSTTIKAEDSCTMPITLDSLVSPEEMKEILKEVLGKESWEVEGGAATTKLEDGQHLTWDLDKSEVRGEVKVELVIEDNSKVKVVLDTDYSQSTSDAIKQKALKMQEALVLQKAKDKEASMQKEITNTLDKGEKARKEKINGVLQKVYGEALKRKARQLGQVTSIQESNNDNGYSLTITIEE